MPRGFLVKRAGKSHGGYTSYRQRHSSAEEDGGCSSAHSDSGSEPDQLSGGGATQYGSSPDSGFSQSPINLTFKPEDAVTDHAVNNNRLNGVVIGKRSAVTGDAADIRDNQMFSDSFKRDQLQIKFKLLDNYGFRRGGPHHTATRRDPNEGVINYSKNRISSTTTAKDTTAPSIIDTENDVNIANTRSDLLQNNATKISPKALELRATEPRPMPPGGVYGQLARDQDLRNHNNPLGLLRALDRRDLTASSAAAASQHQRLLPPPPRPGLLATAVNSGVYSEQFVNHLKKQQQQFFAAAAAASAAAAAAAKVSAASLASSSPPLSVGTGSPYTSPLYYTAFDRLSVSSSPGKHLQQQLPPSAAGEHPTQGPASSSSSGSARSSPAPSSPNKRRASGDCIAPSKAKVIKKPKSARKIAFEEDKSSPVSGTIIRDWDDDKDHDSTKKVVCGDIDSNLNVVEATPEARAEIERIENKIGDYVCQLCKDFFDDAFQLASHRCPRIVHIEYRCPECDKVFNCPANLASHRRWHKPRPNGNSTKTSTKVVSSSEGLAPGMTVLDRQTPSPNGTTIGRDEAHPQFICAQCGKKFKRQAYLKKHQATHLNVVAPVTHKPALSTDLPSPVKPNHLPYQPQLASPPPPAPVRPIEIRPLEAYDCKYCPSSFNNSPGLASHINKCHSSESRQVSSLLQMPISPRTC